MYVSAIVEWRAPKSGSSKRCRFIGRAQSMHVKREAKLDLEVVTAIELCQRYQGSIWYSLRGHGKGRRNVGNYVSGVKDRRRQGSGQKEQASLPPE